MARSLWDPAETRMERIVRLLVSAFCIVSSTTFIPFIFGALWHYGWIATGLCSGPHDEEEIYPVLALTFIMPLRI